MSFRFNFSHTSETDIKDDVNIKLLHDGDVHSQLSVSYSKDCDYLLFSTEILEKTNEDVSLLKIGDFEVKYVLVNSVKVLSDDETFSQINALQTDLIPGKYEGGLKIWECSVDLASYVSEHVFFQKEDAVLELGCGAGLPGIISYLKGASVTFQDYNPEVLKYSTIPNTVLNTPDDKVSLIPESCQYLFGDWESIHEKYYVNSSTKTKYDYILTSETIYDLANQKKLLELMKSALKSTGTIYLAAKIFYFGVGGGIADFEMLVNDDKTFEITSIQRITSGLERQILTMKFR